MQFKPQEEDLTLVVTGHGVADYDAWLKVFTGACEAPKEENFHRNVLQVKYHLAAQQTNPKQGTSNPCCLVVAVSPSSTDAIMEGVLKYEGEPFDTFKKDGTMIPPFEPNMMGRLVADRWDVPEEEVGEDLKKNPGNYMVYVASHGVPSFDKWYTEAFGGGAPMPAELRDGLGVVRTLVAKGPKRTVDDQEQETCIVLHVFRKAGYDAFAQLAKYDAPPFVGGPDFIGNGLVIPPFDINLFADAALSFEY